MPLTIQLVEFDLQLLLQQSLSVLGRTTQNLANTQEMRLLLIDYTRIGRDRYLAIGECVECVDGLVGRLVGRNVNDDLDLLRGVILHLADLDLALLVSFDDRLLDTFGCSRKRNLGDGQRALVDLRDTCSNLHRATAQTVIVARAIDQTSRRKVGQQGELLALQVRHASVNQLVEVVGQDLRRQTYGDTLHALRQQQRELNRQRYRLLITTVIRRHPLGGFGIEHHIERKFRQSSLDITRSRSSVTRQNVTPVTLAVDQQILLSELYQCVTNRGVAVGVELHRVTDDIRHLVVATVVHTFHRVQDTSLYGFQTVLDVGHSALQNYVRGVIQKPILIHTREFACAAGVLHQLAEFTARALRGLLLGHVQLVGYNIIFVHLSCYFLLFHLKT